MTRFIAIDPGPEQSGFVVYRPDFGRVLDPETGIPCETFGIEDNEVVRDLINGLGLPVVCESVDFYGMAVGKDVFRTCYEIGRYWEVAIQSFSYFHLLPRKEIKLQLCNSSRAKDKNIRRALLDRFPSTGGGATPQVGIKAQPGPLYGFSTHLWSALAVAVAWVEIQAERAR